MFHVVKPLPDEYFEGHYERIRTLNVLSRQTTTRLMMVKADEFTDGNWRRRKSVKISLIAAASEMDVSDYLMKHTTFPFQYCIRRESFADMEIADLAESGLARGGARCWFMCAECALKDRSRKGNGYPYLRNLHQLPGLRWCPIHKTPLIGCNSKMQPVPDPLQSIYDRKRVTPFMERYSSIAIAMLRSEGNSFDPDRYRLELIQRAERMGIQTRRGSKALPLLSTAIASCADPDWICELFPGYSSRDAARPFSVDTALCRHYHSSEALAITLAYLYGSSAEAMAEMRKFSLQPAPRGRGLASMDRDTVFAAYVLERGRLRGTRRRLGVSPGVNASKWLPPACTWPISHAVRDVLFRGSSPHASARRHKVALERLTRVLEFGGERLKSALTAIDAHR